LLTRLFHASIPQGSSRPNLPTRSRDHRARNLHPASQTRSECSDVLFRHLCLCWSYLERHSMDPPRSPSSSLETEVSSTLSSSRPRSFLPLTPSSSRSSSVNPSLKSPSIFSSFTSLLPPPSRSCDLIVGSGRSSRNGGRFRSTPFDSEVTSLALPSPKQISPLRRKQTPPFVSLSIRSLLSSVVSRQRIRCEEWVAW